MKKNFRFPMKKSEAVIGWIYLFIHIFALTFILIILDEYLFPVLGFSLTDTQFNLVYYAVGFVFILIFLFNYLRSSFRDLCSNKLMTLSSVALGFLLYFFASMLVSAILSLFLADLINPNTAAVDMEAKLNPNTMIVISVLLAPIVEEVLFRGAVFGTIRKKSRLLAYMVSAILFAFYHLWSYMLYSFSWDLVLFLLQYIPPALILCWCYERSRSIWGPIFLHMLINYVSISVTLG